MLEPRLRHFATTCVALLFCGALGAAADPPGRDVAKDPKKKAATIGIGLAAGQGLYPRINHVTPDTPAGRSGKIRPNDLVIAVGQGDQTPVSTERMPIAEAVKLIRGPEGTVVTLKILHEGQLLRDATAVSLTRGAFEGQGRFGDGKFLAPGTPSPGLKARSLIRGEPDLDLKPSKDEFVVLIFWGEWLAASTDPFEWAQRTMDAHPEWLNRVKVIAVSTDDDPELAGKRFSQLTRRSDDIMQVWAGPSVLKTFHVDLPPAVYLLDPQLRVVAADHQLNFPIVLKTALDSQAPANPAVGK